MNLRRARPGMFVERAINGGSASDRRTRKEPTCAQHIAFKVLWLWPPNGHARRRMGGLDLAYPTTCYGCVYTSLRDEDGLVTLRTSEQSVLFT